MFTPIEGVRYAIHIYVTSDALAADVVVTLEGERPLRPLGERRSLKELVEYAGVEPFSALRGADDWRLMTADEIAQYKEASHA